jgi:hypothetical protein
VRTPTTALLWQMWRSKRHSAVALIAITIGAWIADIATHGWTPVRSGGAPGPLNELAAMASFVLLLAVFSYTEPSGDKGIGRFPQRLFILPVTTLRIIAIPMVSGVLAIVLLYATWMNRFTTDGSTSRIYVAVLLAAFMVFYQTVLWTLDRAGAFRIVMLGTIAVVLFVVGLHPASAGIDPPVWRTAPFLGSAVALAAVGSFLFSWSRISAIRSGGDRGTPRGPGALIARVMDLLPRRRAPFASASAAQFWYEWRSAGAVLPLLVAANLLLGAPLVSSPGDAGAGMGFLVTALLSPIVLAMPVGMAFAKPMFWSEDLSVPAFIGTRPLSGADFVAVKLGVAAASAAVSWLIVIAVLGGWLAFSANTDGVSVLAIQLWAFHDHSVLAVWGIAALVVAAGILLTWRFLVSGMWAGLSGSRRLHVWSLIALGLVAVGYLVSPANRLPAWLMEDPARMPPFAWAAAIAVIAKYWLAARTWRGVAPSLVRRYVVVWFVATATLIVLGMVVLRMLRIYVAVDAWRLQSLLILLALLAVPLARTGLAASMFEHNRHRR